MEHIPISFYQFAKVGLDIIRLHYRHTWKDLWYYCLLKRQQHNVPVEVYCHKDQYIVIVRCASVSSNMYNPNSNTEQGELLEEPY